MPIFGDKEWMGPMNQESGPKVGRWTGAGQQYANNLSQLVRVKDLLGYHPPTAHIGPNSISHTVLMLLLTSEQRFRSLFENKYAYIASLEWKKRSYED